MTDGRLATLATEAGPEQQPHRRDAGPQTDRGHARKAELLAAARLVFERQGFLDARVSDIAEEAGVSQGTFYTYFESKEAVFRAVAADVAERMLAALRPTGPRPDNLFDQVREATRRFVAAYRAEARLIVVIAQLGPSTPEIADLRLSVREAFVQRTARGIQLQQAQGSADPGLDADLASEVLGSMVDQACWVWLALGREFDEEALLDTLTVVWTRALGVQEPTRVTVPGRTEA